MNKREWLEILGAVSLAAGCAVAAMALIALYLAAIGVGLGALVGAAVWVFRALTGW